MARRKVEFVPGHELDVRVKGVDAIEGVTVDMANKARYGGFVSAIAERGIARSKMRFSREQIESMRKADLPAKDEEFAAMLQDFPLDWKRVFFQHNKLVQPTHDGPPEIVPRLPRMIYDGPVNAPVSGEERVAREAADAVANKRRATRAGKQRAAAQVKPVKTYKLVSVFSDTEVAPALQLTSADVSMAAKLAVEAPMKAVEFLKRRCVQNGITANFEIGGYSKNRKACRRQVMDAASTLRGWNYTVEVVGGAAVISSEQKTTDGLPIWTLTGSVWQMPEMDALHRMCMMHGPTQVGSLFEFEMAVLGIQFEVGTPDFGVGITEHTGVVSSAVALMGAWGVDGQGLPPNVVQFARRVVPYIDSGNVTGTAVLAGDDTAYVNWHVVSSGSTVSDAGVGLKIGNTVEAVRMLDEVTPDVWRCEVQMPSSHFTDMCVSRRAAVGEKAIMVYATPVGTRFSDVVEVARVEGSSIVMKKLRQAVPGTSGAALVALSDGALLGMYRGSNSDWSVFCAIVGKKSKDRASVIAALETLGTDMREGTGRVVYDGMVMRGLGPRLASVVSCIEALHYRGEQVGSGFCVAGRSYTSMDPGLWTFEDKQGHRLAYLPTLAGGVRERYDVQASGVKHRLAVEGESVVLVARDTAGDVVFTSVGKVDSVGGATGRFRISGVSSDGMCNLGSATVVAVSDACALGQVASRVESKRGLLFEANSWHLVTCGTLDAMEGPSADVVRVALADKFNYMQVAAWTGADLQSVCSPKGTYPDALRDVGERAAYAIVAEAALRHAESYATGTVVPLLEPGALRSAAFEVFPSEVVKELEKEADLETAVNTLFGVIAVREGHDVLAKLLEDVGLVGARGRTQGRHGMPEGFAMLARRPSSV